MPGSGIVRDQHEGRREGHRLRDRLRVRKEGRDLLKVIAPFLKPMSTSTTLGSMCEHHVNVQPGHLVVQELLERAFVYVRHASENPDLLDP